jgi:hypothetical protein
MIQYLIEIIYETEEFKKIFFLLMPMHAFFLRVIIEKRIIDLKR